MFARCCSAVYHSGVLLDALLERGHVSMGIGEEW